MPLAHIRDFIGYGTPAPRVIFLGTEESAGGANPAANVAVRLLEFDPIMDLLIGCQLLVHAAGFVNPFAEPRDRVQQWNRAAQFRLALAGEPWDEPDTWRTYWREELGRAAGDTLLMECFPVPRAGMHVEVEGYDPEADWPARRAVLAEAVSAMQPEFVVAYGRIARDRVSELFPVQFTKVGGIEDIWHKVTGTAGEIARTETGACVARVPFFGQGQFRQVEIGPITVAMRALRAQDP